LIDWFAGLDSVVVAFSGGVDSSVVLAAAKSSGAARVLAVTARSPSVPRWQLELARSIAEHVDVQHRILDTDETTRPEYVANQRDRCFHCKTTLYAAIAALCQQYGPDATVCSGTNRDDLGDYRPGIAAGTRAGVRTPLAELGLGKQDVRAIARQFSLPNAELPASPCLASRIAYGVEVTPERLRRVELAEQFLRSLDIGDLRVRLHEGELARIEVPPEQLHRLATPSLRQRLSEQLTELGFRYVTLDLQGLCSGSMNRQVVPLEAVPVGPTGGPASEKNGSDGKAASSSSSEVSPSDASQTEARR
jgi:uncharacterized protein